MSLFLKPLQGTCSWSRTFLGSPATAPEGIRPVTVLYHHFLPGFSAKCLYNASQLCSQGSLTKHSHGQEQHTVVPLSVHRTYILLPVSSSLHPPAHLFIHLPVHLSISLSICLVLGVFWEQQGGQREPVRRVVRDEVGEVPAHRSVAPVKSL